MSFQDHFSQQAASYARFRPTYPPELFTFLAERSPGLRVAWDCATGNGQAALALSEHFDRVEATDGSRRQVEQAIQHPRVRYRVATAEKSGLATASVQLIAVAQAIHWFPFEAFYQEVSRVACPRALFAAWGYGLLRTGEVEIDRVLTTFYTETVGPFWPPERAHLDNGYDSIPCPLTSIPTPSFSMKASWNLRELVGYLGTWSAVHRYRQTSQQDPIPAVYQLLEAVWGSEEHLRKIHWPVFLKVGRLP